ncbi:hypothetical protein [Methylomonas sp. UP202]|uniref:hypothetical protein n=1 Tax=Methylomonas sp. UP202 TaxID=3040943 RepID=UPI0024783C1B|nr:hypothetical protein [Methylomonas sp. UP202]WGS85487.1 hypothetical protein QC632_20990 [Methylomonas sp. UP202]
MTLNKDGMVDLKLIFMGYDAAYERLKAQRVQAKKEDDSRLLYVPLLETLGWADVIEERLEDGHGKDWIKKLPLSQDLEGIVLGFRYARNVVHHRWHIAVELDDEPGILKDWRWKEYLPSTGKPQPTNKAAYENNLAGRALRHAFKDLHRIYGAAELHLS